MSYCINPHCKHPQNPAQYSYCQSCGFSLKLKDRYRIIKVLGQSVTSRTFLAVDEDQPSKSRCVIKQFLDRDQSHSSSAPDDAVNLRLVPISHIPATELERLGKHLAIPQLWASFQQDGYHYYVHEYISGNNLATELDHNGVFREAQVWQLLNDVLPTLEHIHENNVVHADIKPENLIRRSPSAFDSEIEDDEPEIRLVDIGSAMYPEDALILEDNRQGSAEYSAPEQIHSQPNPSSDLYSVGVTCLHLMTQVSPFDLYDVKSSTWVWRDYVKYPISRRLSKVLDKMVQRHPAQRYQSVPEVMEDLKARSVLGLNTLSTRQKLMLTAWGGAVVAVASLILSSIPSNVSRLSSQQQEHFNRIPDVHLTPPEIKRIPPKLHKTPAVRTLMRSYSPVWAIAVSPNGQVVASGNTDGSIKVLDMETGEVLYTLSGHSSPVGALAISPNGRLLVSGSGDQTLKVWDLWSGKLISMLYGHKAWVYSVAFSPDGQTIASVSRDQTLRLWDVETSEEIGQLKGYAEDVQSMVFSPDSQTLVSGSGDGTIEVWNWRTRHLLRSLKGHPEAIWSVAITPDGRTLATGSWDQSVKLWDLNRLQSEYFNSLPERTLIGHGDKVQSLSFSADGQTLASGDFAGTIKLWQIHTGGLMGTLKGHKSWVDVEFSLTDNTLVSGSFDDTVKVWRLSP